MTFENDNQIIFVRNWTSPDLHAITLYVWIDKNVERTIYGKLTNFLCLYQGELRPLVEELVELLARINLPAESLKHTNFGTRVQTAGFSIANAFLAQSVSEGQVQISDINILVIGEGLTPDPFTWESQSSDSADLDSMESILFGL